MKNKMYNLKTVGVTYNATYSNLVTSIQNGQVKNHREMPVDFRKPVGLVKTAYDFTFETVSSSLAEVEEKPKRSYTKKASIWFFRRKDKHRNKYLVAHHQEINLCCDECWKELVEKQKAINFKWPSRKRLKEYEEICASYGFQLVVRGKKAAVI